MSKTKKITISILAVFFVIALCAIFLYPRYVTSPETSNTNQTTTTETAITAVDKQINYKESPFNIEITYPEIAGLDDFNQKARNIIDTEISNFKTNSLENDAAVKETDPVNYADYPREYDLIISYSKGEIDNETVSVVFNVYNFEGGAHGATYFIPLNYNINTKQIIKLADLFPGQSDYLQKISETCIKDLTTQISATMGEYMDVSWISEGAGPKEENYSTFLINKDNIVFYFPQYQVAPYVAGDFRVVIPK